MKIAFHKEHDPTKTYGYLNKHKKTCYIPPHFTPFPANPSGQDAHE